ncbi:MAG: tetratricopeptide repeat protein, partial [Deltaproteobacteria bacterium]|nr:tetratricopeptide repeat protein [Deltaproteobacteria bacterium]
MKLAAPLPSLLILGWSAALIAAPIPVQSYTPYLKGKVGRHVRSSLVGKDYRDAAKSLAHYLKMTRTHRKQTEFLLAYALFRQGDHARAATIFGRLVRSYPLLSDYHRYLHGRCLYKLRSFAAAEEEAQAVGPRSALAVDAMLLRADALRALHKAPQAAEIWRNYLRQRPYGARAGEAHLRIGETLEASARRRTGGSATLRRQAAASYRRTMVRAPLSRHATAAEIALQRLATTAGKPNI